MAMKGKEFIKFAMEHAQDNLVYIVRDKKGTLDYVGVDPRDNSIIFSGGWLDQEDISMMTEEGLLLHFYEVSVHPDLYVSVEGGVCQIKSLSMLKKFVASREKVLRDLGIISVE